jgi:dsDNA-specific endonuclease/ATPase MutS2
LNYLPFLIKGSMQNQEIVKIIENLKGRRNYEEKRASKLGFASLYDYFEDKISKKQKALEDEQKELETSQAEKQPKAAKKSCGCC